MPMIKVMNAGHNMQHATQTHTLADHDAGEEFLQERGGGSRNFTNVESSKRKALHREVKASFCNQPYQHWVACLQLGGASLDEAQRQEKDVRKSSANAPKLRGRPKGV